jgi:uncharacterized protein (UPF0548 family)
VFTLSKSSPRQTQELLARARYVAPGSPDLLTLSNGAPKGMPTGFAHDFSCSEIGRGLRTFQAACEAFRRWKQFDLGWVCAANPDAEIKLGELVVVEAHTAWLWSANVSRITEVVDQPHCFGFLYTTTTFHVEEGQERFVIELDAKTETVTYLIEAVSRPRHPLARLAYPFARAMQHQFAQESHARMKIWCDLAE